MVVMQQADCKIGESGLLQSLSCSCKAKLASRPEQHAVQVKVRSSISAQ